MEGITKFLISGDTIDQIECIVSPKAGARGLLKAQPDFFCDSNLALSITEIEMFHK